MGRKMVLILRQDIRASGRTFNNKAEAMSHNANDASAYLYSQLDKLDHYRSETDGKFFFFLRYPELDPVKGIKWKQTENPLTLTSECENVLTFPPN